MGIWAIIIGIVLIILGIFESIFVVRAFKQVQTKGNSQTSPFIAYGLWSGVVVAIFLFLVGIVTMIAFR